MPNFNIHWKIPFMSLRTGTLYTVNIWKDGALPSGYPLTLKGGAHPFVTQEDDNEDQFTPLRTQTGYLRIIDDGKAVNASNQSVAFSWKDLMPSTDTDRPVTLTHQSGGATVVDWQGYMQAQTFTGELYDGVQEREFPIQCPLSALTASNVDDANRALQNSLALGYGLVINNSDFTFMEKAAYPSTTEHPEQRLATRVANYWASAKRKLATELRADAIPSISPRNKVTLDQTTAYPISISRDWLDDIVKLTLLEA